MQRERVKVALVKIKTNMLLPLLFAAASAVSEWDYAILRSYRHDTALSTEGLAVLDRNYILESTGGYNSSTLLIININTGAVQQEASLSGDLYGSGVTILNNKAYQLTRDRTMLVYSLEDLSLIESVDLPDVLDDAWGICTDGTYFYISVSTHKVYKLTVDTYDLYSYIIVHQQGSYITDIGELQYINGLIWAVVDRTHYIVVFNPSDGTVTDWVALYGIEHDGDYVDGNEGSELSGVAEYEGEIVVTGHKWGHYYSVEVTTGYSCDEVPQMS